MAKASKCCSDVLNSSLERSGAQWCKSHHPTWKAEDWFLQGAIIYVLNSVKLNSHGCSYLHKHLKGQLRYILAKASVCSKRFVCTNEHDPPSLVILGLSSTPVACTWGPGGDALWRSFFCWFSIMRGRQNFRCPKTLRLRCFLLPVQSKLSHVFLWVKWI